MRSFAIVTHIDGKNIHVVPLISDACIACTMTHCARHGKSITVCNKNNLTIEENAIVKIGYPRIRNALYGILALLVPIACAVIAYFFSPHISAKLGLQPTQETKACIVVLSTLTSSGIIFLLSRTSLHFSTPEITHVL